MRIGGLQRFTLVDYPGKLACTVFTVGCPFRSPWCHSPELVGQDGSLLEVEKILRFLQEKQDHLEGVVVTGGEPTLDPGLREFLGRVKKMGFKTKLDTNGTDPKLLRELIYDGLLDYVAMDIKAPKDRYIEVIGLQEELKSKDWVKRVLDRIEDSMDILKRGKVDYEFRTTVVPGFLSKEDVVEIAKWIAPAPSYFLQEFKMTNIVDPNFEPGSKEDGFLEDILRAVEPLFEQCRLRRV